MLIVLDLLVSVLSLTVIGHYAWSMKHHFHSKRMPSGAKLITVMVIATTLLFLVLVWREPQPAGAKLAGSLLEGASLGLFWWAIAASRNANLRFAFDADKPDSLVMEGPYAYVRHPFYLSYSLFWTGWAVAVWSPIAIVPVVVFVVTYAIAALIEERKFEASELGATYEAYRRRTGFLFPRLLG